MDIDRLIFTKLTLSDVQTLVSWALTEGWNPGAYDADAFYETDPDGFYGYFHENELIAGGSIVSYGGQFGFMGLFIVAPEYRGKGIGEKLWFERRDKLLSRLQPNAAIGMDGVLAMQSFYHKGGFDIAFRDERYEKIGQSYPQHPSVRRYVEYDFNEVLHYDQQCFGVDRSQFLKVWLHLPESILFVYMENGSLKGFSMLRKVAKGYKICPLFADNFEIAQELYKACLNAAQGQRVYLDIPITNKEAVQLVKTFKASYVFECARMYYGTPPKMSLSKVFGITTFELG